MFRLLSLLCLVSSAAWADPALKIDAMDDVDRPMLRRALSEIYKTCDRLADAKAGIHDISMVQRAVYPGSDVMQFGWKQYVFVTVTFSDNSSFVPRNIANNPVTRQAFFSIGGSPHPGIYVSDPAGHYGCGDFLPFTDRLISAPALAILDKLKD